jgi:uncharacterized protein (TIGR02145 family)
MSNYKLFDQISIKKRMANGTRKAYFEPLKQTKMKKPLFLTVVLGLILQLPSFGQSIKLNNQGDAGSAMLDVSSPSKGILIPNVSLTGSTDVTTITSPAVSLLVYNTATVSDILPGYFYNSGTIVSPFWTRLVTDAVSKAYADLLELRLKAYVDSLFNPIVQPSSVTIGNQKWTDKNLDVSTYRDGTVIPKVDDATWSTLTTGAYCYYNNDSTTYAAIYGKLYNWYAVVGIHDNDANTPNKTLAPEGWHVPTDGEWTTLTDTLGGVSVAGGKMKEAGLAHWASPNTGATNESGFAGLPGGIRSGNGRFYDNGGDSYWWSSTENSTTVAWYRSLVNDIVDVDRNYSVKGSGFSVRCLRD